MKKINKLWLPPPSLPTPTRAHPEAQYQVKADSELAPFLLFKAFYVSY